MRNAIAANSGRTEREKPRPKDPRYAKDLALKSAELLALRQEWAAAIADEKALSKTKMDSLSRYMRTQPITTPEENIRRHLAAALAYRVGLADGSIAPPPEPAPRKVWPLEASYAARGAAPKKRAFLGSIAATKKLGLKY